jgi:hypothetical protein
MDTPASVEAMERVQGTFNALIESGHPLPFKIAVIVDGNWMELGFVDPPQIGQQE